MEHLWAPWRIRYILAPKEETGCFVCRKAQSADDVGNHVLLRDKTCFALLNTYPYNAGHLMVAPYKHTGTWDDLADQELADLMLLARRCQQLLQRVMKPEGYNVGINFGRAAGAGVEDHLHLHIVPRWNGDTNYMPVLGDVRVIPQALDELCHTLRTALNQP
jgi:ATP adenylyltransferase